ncbi:phage tail protein [Paenibacillus agilis]|uniref:Phage tail protein n=1 Tax=Paenibacillus agilis TaxID=3020863 RepID=A0A559IZL2_9BACL|nr:phage tail protein [Paenibacillus agilis]TVX93053.1 phage tail protein [Paenibacillus agilis]
MIGAFGEVNFLVTNEKIRTYDDFVRTCSPRWADHEVIGKKPVSQFIGPGLDEISFSMSFRLSLGIDPRYEIDRLVNMQRSGKPFVLTIGKKAIGTYKWVLVGFEEKHVAVSNKGLILSADVSVRLKEYAR